MIKERTLVLLKPDTLQRSQVGEIIRRIESTGLKLVAIKMLRATEKQLVEHYHKDDEWYMKKGVQRTDQIEKDGKPVDKDVIEYGKDIIRGNVKFMTASPLVAMVWQGNKAAGIVKKLVGGTEPLTSDVGTIRGDLTLDSFELSDSEARAIRNLIHCSDKEEAIREIKIWFTPEELYDYRHIAEEILYDIDLDGLRE
ncbi:MAG: hypothetical protein A3I39_01880 [Candidatus Yanofskybacteria bacterium RIFCSPLOWO2_02_FULL_47_9b]|uniref:nucleoside-diphosphate kinase n=1 Tax=Candidatus Yanofskybacteria bacterium RIFCSPLOWO2_02_FULL_47_9b TaxID=1802708 RepID=A0A1F8H9U6_9BACT|nr:MAG: hypothetical protein A3I39_01880 [Candidatus Yanofskybacteria bacterium RIFCSPLOWO2_02_FULL_47_9b]